MEAVTTPLIERARSIFTDLGYTVSEDGSELRAERKWRVVYVTPHVDVESLPSSGDMRCFVTWADGAARLRRELAAADLDYEWAVMGVYEDGDYVVLNPPEAA